MRQVTVSTVISAPREQVFDFVCDLAGRPAYTDHYLRDFRLARVNPVGRGAAARFQLRAPLAKEYAELEIRTVDRPREIVEEIRVGRRGRNRSLAVYEFTVESGGMSDDKVSQVLKSCLDDLKLTIDSMEPLEDDLLLLLATLRYRLGQIV